LIQFGPNELKKRIDEVLYYVWDPIGVSDCPQARHEYLGYVDEILTLVIKNDNIEPISTRLNQIVIDSMGLPGNKRHCDSIAELLLDHKSAIETGDA